jgi:hypothetical protein
MPTQFSLQNACALRTVPIHFTDKLHTGLADTTRAVSQMMQSFRQESSNLQLQGSAVHKFRIVSNALD